MTLVQAMRSRTKSDFPFRVTPHYPERIEEKKIANAIEILQLLLLAHA